MRIHPIKKYVKDLLLVVSRMQKDYPKRKFTLDGRIVGDIGEMLAEQMYEIELFAGQKKTHDAKSHGRLVQIKTTMKDSLTFGDIPDYYLGLRVDHNGKVDEIYNGPGKVIWDTIKHRKRPKSFLYSITLSCLRQLNSEVESKDKIKRRKLS